MSPRAAGIDALRAIALMAVVVVNVVGYRVLPAAGPLPPLEAGDGGVAWTLSFLTASLLQGKGVALLNFLLGYSLVLGRASHARTRVRRLLLLGLLHGFLLYNGDILSLYALCAFLALRRRQERLRVLIRRSAFWMLTGLLLVAGLLYLSAGMPMGASAEPPLVVAPSLGVWLVANAKAYGLMLIATPLLLPFSYGLSLAGMVAGRLRLLQHRRWHSCWRRAAAWALPLLLMNLSYGWAYATALRDDPQTALWISGLPYLLGPLSLLGFVPWLLLRRWPEWLSRAGRNTLSLYIGSSMAAVALGMAWQPAPDLALSYVLALLIWLLLARWAAAVQRGPLEAWMVRRPAS